MRGARAGRGARAAWASMGGAFVVVAAACQKDPVITTRAVTLHAPQDCAPGLPNLDGSAFGVYQALGDYQATPTLGGHLLMEQDTALPEIDPAARALLVDATQQDATGQEREWQGATTLAPAGPVDVLLLPATTPCSLRGTLAGAADGGPTMATIGSQRVLLVGQSAVVLRLDTGEVDPVNLPTPRTGATVTAFGLGGLVAGGRAGGAVLATATVYDATTGGFDAPPVALGTPRADAGAVVLATGQTLLVGGVGGDGKTPLATMEIVDPVTRTSHLAGQLAVARSAPTVLRLASGEIFVAGGLDSTGTPVPTLEWFSSDASHATKRTQDLVAGSARAYVALEAGGVLAVVAPGPTDPATFQNTWLIDPDGVIDPATPIEGSLVQPVLFGGAGGAPVLWTGSGSGIRGRWLRWQPWTGAFGALVALDDTPDRVVGAAASPDLGTALWVDTTLTTPQAPQLAGLRFDVRGAYSTLAGPLLVSDTTDTAPDRLPATGVLTFDPTVGLELEPGASAFVSDRTYADVQIDVDAPTGQPALVVLRDALGNEMEVGGAACPGAVVTGAASSITVVRKGASLTWSVSGGPATPCALASDPSASLAVGVRGAPDLIRSVASNLRVTRLGKP